MKVIFGAFRLKFMISYIRLLKLNKVITLLYNVQTIFWCLCIRLLQPQYLKSIQFNLGLFPSQNQMKAKR